MIKKISFIIAVATFLVCCKGKEAKVVTLPFKIYDRVQMIEVRVGEKKVLAHFILDTGSEITGLDKSFAKKHGFVATGSSHVEGSSGGQAYEVSDNHSLEIGDASLENITFTLLSLGMRYNEFGESYNVDGIIGADIMKLFTMQIDYDNTTVTLYPKGVSFLKDGFSEIPFTHTGDYFPRIDIATTLINGEKLLGKTFFDSGATATLIYNTPFAEENSIRDKASAYVLRRTNDVHGKGYNEVVRIKDITIGNFTMEALPADISTATNGVGSYTGYLGMIGSEVIKKFNYIIDSENKKLYLKPNNSFQEAFIFPLTTIPTQQENGHLLVYQEVYTNVGKDEVIEKGSEILTVDGKQFSDPQSLLSYIYKKGDYEIDLKTPKGKVKKIRYRVVDMI